MSRWSRGAWPCIVVVVVALACARAPASSDGEGAALAAAEALARARRCAGDLERLDARDVDAVAGALGLEAVRLAPVRGRLEEMGTVRAAIEDRLEDARASTGAARALARLEREDASLPRGPAAERARRSVRAADALCEAAAALRLERLARSHADRPPPLTGGIVHGP